ncbi:MAG: hypothetical protein J0L69_09925 [Bacteroidetes bacterium]|nr:hypothetical protein [Bacteroidota bacterium]
MTAKITYPEIQKLYGVPLDHVAKPHQPFKLTTTHYVVGGVIICLAAYGAYCIFKDVSSKFEGKTEFKFRHKDKTQPDA